MEDSYVLQLLKPKFKDFHLCFCGFAECKPLHSYGPAARPNYILLDCRLQAVRNLFLSFIRWQAADGR